MYHLNPLISQKLSSWADDLASNGYPVFEREMDALKLTDRMPQAIEKAPTRVVVPEMANACPQPDIETPCHDSRQGIQASAIGPLRLHVLEGIALLNVPLPIEAPDGFRDSNQIGCSEASGDQSGAHRTVDRTPALDILCAMVIGETLLPPGCSSSTYPIASLKHRDNIACVTQYMCGGEPTASGADNGD